MKDINYLEINKEFEGQLMKLDKKQYDSLKWLTKMDSEFLSKHNLMDYSMLLVIESVKIEQMDEESEVVESIGVSSINSQKNPFNDVKLKNNFKNSFSSDYSI